MLYIYIYKYVCIDYIYMNIYIYIYIYIYIIYIYILTHLILEPKLRGTPCNYCKIYRYQSNKNYS